MNMIYLNRLHFIQMLMLAFLLHFVAFVVWNFMPKHNLLTIPVRALNIKLGGGTEEAVRQAAPASPATNTTSALIGMLVPEAGKKEVQEEKRNLDSVINSLEAAIGQKLTRDEPLPLPDKHKRKPAAPSGSTLANALPAEYVRQGQGAGNPLGDSTRSDAERVINSYTQLISLWIKRHKTFPAEANRLGIQGEGIIRVRINRSGKILNYAIDRSTGYAILDQAMIDMVKAADPVPPAPANYPVADLMDFQIPTSFYFPGR